MDSSSTPCLSFIGIVDFSQEARWIYMTDSVTDLLGYEPSELRGRPSLELVHPDEAARVRQLHYETIKQDKAAVLVYLRMKHKNPMKGYILCGISRTVVHNVLIGSVSFATSGAKALHNASTAQEITVISPAPELEFRRWHDPSPMPPSPIPLSLQKVPPLDTNCRSLYSPASSSSSALSQTSSLQRSPSPTSSDPSSGSPVPSSRPPTQTPSPPPSHLKLPNPTRVASLLTDSSPSGISFPTPPSQSSRTALILNRFSRHCMIMYCSNDHLIYAPGRINVWEQRSFFDFIATKDEDRVRSWIDVVKSWGVNERGQPSDGGFGFGKFGLVSGGRSLPSSNSPHLSRDSRILRDHREQEPRPRAHRNPHSTSSGRRHSHAHANGVKEIVINGGEDVIEVDAIFSAHSDGLMVILRRAT
ncbi:hypothetical protein E1B28_012119 [Marasmius oreades]|uniref:PAS domain-containing protein n=1 Tax=Marasmius oreades TaxID=181124 RepID=A0A9P7RS53_9AGAR|nr:uncharacterized protein E1B28_012119 [Marasmius oreades]KAG7088093.1 hypothetical protein E1B28_012119 [Marasmius oreades]